MKHYRRAAVAMVDRYYSIKLQKEQAKFSAKYLMKYSSQLLRLKIANIPIAERRVRQALRDEQQSMPNQHPTIE